MTSAKDSTLMNQFHSSRRLTVVLIAGIFVLLARQGSWAQTGRAHIGGTVTDSQGAMVAGAKVTATNHATGVATPTTTNSAGAYNIIQLIPGSYTITAEKEGFSTARQPDYTLEAEQNAGANFTLRPGQVRVRA